LEGLMARIEIDSGVVLRESVSGEADKVVTALLRNTGKRTFFAKGAKNAKSKLAPVQPFSYCEFSLRESGGFTALCQVTAIDSFYGAASSLEALVAAAFCAELTDALIQPGMAAPRALTLLLAVLGVLSKAHRQPLTVMSAFLFRILMTEGFSPELDCCSVCRGEYWVESDESDKGGGFNYFGSDGVVCRNCAENIHTNGTRTNDSRAAVSPICRIDPASLHAIKHSVSNFTDFSDFTDLAKDSDFTKSSENESRLFSFYLKEPSASRFLDAAKLFLAFHTEREFRSLKMLEY
jgi:DNA repair protein RecO (recombination protein O)